MNNFKDIPRDELARNVKNVICDFINVQEYYENFGLNKVANIKPNLKRMVSIRNIVNTLRLTPFQVLRTCWSNISLNSHKNRNINQSYREPDTLEKMKMLEDVGLFKLLGKKGPTKGHTGAHNISQGETGLFGRWNNFLTLDGHGENLDYRGITGSAFDGVQCIYNENTGKLVTKDLNKGTYDYCHPSRNNFHHFIYDVLPWVVWSNCGDDPPRKQVIPNATWKQIEEAWNKFSKGEITKEEAQTDINSIIETNHPINNKVKLVFDASDKPDFDELEIKETQSSESYFSLSILDDVSMKVPTNLCHPDDILSFFD
jgi:hypothetical protein